MNIRQCNSWCALLLLIAPMLSAAPGQLDPNFGSGGFRVDGFITGAAYESARAIHIQRSPNGFDNRIVVAGVQGNRVVLRRYLDNGQPDASFGFFGVTGGNGQVDAFAGLVSMSNGDLVVGYSSNSDGGGPADDFYIEVFTSNGGLRTELNGGFAWRGNPLTRQSVCCGAVTTTCAASSMARAPNGTIAIGGYCSGDLAPLVQIRPALALFDSNYFPTPLPDFGSTGMFTSFTPFNNGVNPSSIYQLATAGGNLSALRWLNDADLRAGGHFLMGTAGQNPPDHGRAFAGYVTPWGLSTTCGPADRGCAFVALDDFGSPGQFRTDDFGYWERRDTQLRALHWDGVSELYGYGLGRYSMALPGGQYYPIITAPTASDRLSPAWLLPPTSMKRRNFDVTGGVSARRNDEKIHVVTGSSGGCAHDLPCSFVGDRLFIAAVGSTRSYNAAVPVTGFGDRGFVELAVPRAPLNGDFRPGLRVRAFAIVTERSLLPLGNTPSILIAGEVLNSDDPNSDNYDFFLGRVMLE